MKIRAIISGHYFGDDVDIRTITVDRGVDYGDAFDDVASALKDAIDTLDATASGQPLATADTDFLAFVEAEYVTYHTWDGEEHDIEYDITLIDSLTELSALLASDATVINRTVTEPPEMFGLSFVEVRPKPTISHADVRQMLDQRPKGCE